MILVGGSINLLLSIWVILLGGFSVAIVTGVLITVIGILYLARPYFVVEPSRIVLYNLFGMPMKQYAIEPYSTVRIENNKLYIHTKDSQTKVNVTKWLANADDWQKLQQLDGVN